MYARYARLLFALSLAAVVALNGYSFFHYQSSTTREKFATGWFHPLRARDATTLAGVSRTIKNGLIRNGTRSYYVAHELLKGREVTMPRLPERRLWPWRHIVLIDPLILDGQIVSPAVSRGLRARSSSVLSPRAISLDMLWGSEIYMFVDAQTPSEIDVRILRDAKGGLFVLQKQAADQMDELQR
jgi:hypothetical protein